MEETNLEPLALENNLPSNDELKSIKKSNSLNKFLSVSKILLVFLVLTATFLSLWKLYNDKFGNNDSEFMWNIIWGDWFNPDWEELWTEKIDTTQDSTSSSDDLDYIKTRLLEFVTNANDFLADLDDNNLQNRFDKLKDSRIEFDDKFNIKKHELIDHINNLKNQSNVLFWETDIFIEVDSILSKSIWIMEYDGEFTPIIKKWSILPASWSWVFKTAPFPRKKRIEFPVYKWEASLAKNNTNIWMFVLKWLTPSDNIDLLRAEVVFEIDKNWKLKYSVKDLYDQDNTLTAYIDSQIDFIARNKWKSNIWEIKFKVQQLINEANSIILAINKT